MWLFFPWIFKKCYQLLMLEKQNVKQNLSSFFRTFFLPFFTTHYKNMRIYLTQRIPKNHSWILKIITKNKFFRRRYIIFWSNLLLQDGKIGKKKKKRKQVFQIKFATCARDWSWSASRNKTNDRHHHMQMQRVIVHP